MSSAVAAKWRALAVVLRIIYKRLGGWLSTEEQRALTAAIEEIEK